MREAIVDKSSVTEAGNMSAEFWTLSTAKKEYFNKVLSTEEYALIAPYFNKLCVKHGIAEGLKIRIGAYLTSNYNPTVISDMFSEEEIIIAERTILSSLNYILKSQDKNLDLEKLKGNSSALEKILKGITKASTHPSGHAYLDFLDDDAELALQYLKIYVASNRVVTFTREEKIQMNVVLANMSGLAKEQNEKEIAKFKKKLENLMSLQIDNKA